MLPALPRRVGDAAGFPKHGTTTAARSPIRGIGQPVGHGYAAAPCHTRPGVAVAAAAGGPTAPRFGHPPPTPTSTRESRTIAPGTSPAADGPARTAARGSTPWHRSTPPNPPMG